jgi:hypothetical protein
VEKEALHALQLRKKSQEQKPVVTIQMLDGPPWAPHPESLAHLNFDDLLRAATVGYLQGENT